MLGKSQLKYIQSLGHKKHRDDEQLFIAEGPKVVSELLESMPGIVQHIYHTAEAEKLTIPGDVPVTVIDDTDLERMSQLQAPNQVLAVARQFRHDPPAGKISSVCLALDSIRDPGNLGTIIRIADWFGISNIICSDDVADIFNPKVVQATMGSLFRVAVSYTSLPAWLSAHSGSAPIYAAALDGHDIRTVGKLESGIIIIGNESRGISAEVFDTVDQRITIERKGRAESLNAGVATGIILSHLCI